MEISHVGSALYHEVLACRRLKFKMNYSQKDIDALRGFYKSHTRLAKISQKKKRDLSPALFLPHSSPIVPFDQPLEADCSEKLVCVQIYFRKNLLKCC